MQISSDESERKQKPHRRSCRFFEFERDSDVTKAATGYFHTEARHEQPVSNLPARSLGFGGFSASATLVARAAASFVNYFVRKVFKFKIAFDAIM